TVKTSGIGRITGLAALLRSSSYEVFSTTPAPVSYFRLRQALCDKMRTNKVSDIIVIEMLQGVKCEEDQGIC
ncbi:MAG: hypothetical protein AB1403_23985, partial [Candidatus Riflebacteria bacterium]